MSSDILKIIPTDPRWRPGPGRIDCIRNLAVRLAPPPGRRDWDVAIVQHEAIQFVDCGSNFETITCPRCGAEIDAGWWADQLGDRYDHGFDDLATVTPCCQHDCGLDELEYAWICGFAQFEFQIWNPSRGPFTDAEMIALGKALGHPIRQILAHI